MLVHHPWTDGRAVDPAGVHIVPDAKEVALLVARIVRHVKAVVLAVILAVVRTLRDVRVEVLVVERIDHDVKVEGQEEVRRCLVIVAGTVAFQ